MTATRARAVRLVGAAVAVQAITLAGSVVLPPVGPIAHAIRVFCRIP